MFLLDSVESVWDIFGDALSQTVQTIGTILLVLSTIFALLNCFFGYQLKKLWIALIGFAMGFFLGFIPCMLWIDSNAVVGISVAVGLAVGLLLALIAFRLYKVGVFLWVAFLTFASIASWFDGNVEWLGIALGILGGVAVGLLSLRYLRPVCIFSTAVNGGVLAVQNILTLCQIDQTWIVALGGIALAVLGILVQFHLTKGEKKSA